MKHWRSYGTHPLPSGPEALAEPLAAFPSWFLRIECERVASAAAWANGLRAGGAE